MRRHIICLSVLLAGLIISASPAQAGILRKANNSFTKAFVDSNSYTKIISGQMYTSDEKATVTLSAIYKADGSASDYHRVWCKATMDGEPVVVWANNKYYDLKIPAQYCFGGSEISLYAEGYDSSRDCRISGDYIFHSYIHRIILSFLLS